MKKLILLLLSPFVSSYAQESLIDFYPLDIGNQWQYESVLAEFIDGKLDTISIDTLFIEVVGDTVLLNGFRYYDVKGLDGGFRRIDTLKARVYEYNNQYLMPDSVVEYLLWDFSLTDTIDWRDGIGNYITVSSTAQPEQVGKVDEYTPQKIFSGAYLHLKRVFSLGIGESFFTYGCTYPSSQNTLIYAKIKGVEYTSIISKVNSEYFSQQELHIREIYPNPFNESAQISFSLEKDSFIKIDVYNIVGQYVKTLFRGYSLAGSYNMSWDASDIKSGIYFINYNIGPTSVSKKCILVK